MSLRIHVTEDSVYAENSYVVAEADSGVCWLIDPGLPPHAERIIDRVRRDKLHPEAVVLTHAHFDHIAGVDDVRAALGPLPVYLAREEWRALSDPVYNLSGWIGPGLATAVTDPLDLPADSVMKLGRTEWVVLDVSGHSPGGRALYCAGEGVVIVGDALFSGSVGRVDFPTSDGPRLIRNIRNHLLTLPDDTRVLSGHGPATTIGRQRRTNPFILHGLD